MSADNDEITARDRIEAFKVAREADVLADSSPWFAWLLRPLAKLIRWVATEERDNDTYY